MRGTQRGKGIAFVDKGRALEDQTASLAARTRQGFMSHSSRLSPRLFDRGLGSGDAVRIAIAAGVGSQAAKASYSMWGSRSIGGCVHVAQHLAVITFVHFANHRTAFRVHWKMAELVKMVN